MKKVGQNIGSPDKRVSQSSRGTHI